MEESVVRFVLRGNSVEQHMESATTRFDPHDWGLFANEQGQEVRAVRIPRPFVVGARITQDGYLAYFPTLELIRGFDAKHFNATYKPATLYAPGTVPVVDGRTGLPAVD